MRIIAKANIAFWSFWLLALYWCKRNSYDDPSSIFFNEKVAFSERYSATRAAEVKEFLSDKSDAPAYKTPSSTQNLCIGIPSINRTTEGFLAYTVGSLVDKLSVADRESIYIVVLLADKTPTKHFAYGQPWLNSLANEVLVYEQPGVDHSSTGYTVKQFNVRDDGEKRGEGRVENMRLDHSLLVETCRKRGTPYFALVEDDIIASPDWYTRFSKGVVQVEDISKQKNQDWIYLRLFYSEIFMGWNAEEWGSYIQTIFFVYAIVLVAVLVVHMNYYKLTQLSCLGAKRPVGNNRSTWNMITALILGLWMPALIVLFFLAGRISTRRMTPFQDDVREMPNYGCCAQGVVFPNRHLQSFQDLLRNPPFEFAGDQILEDHAARLNLKKWALEPSVFQHSGLKQSSDGGGRTAEVWNFSFERGHK